MHKHRSILLAAVLILISSLYFLINALPINYRFSERIRHSYSDSNLTISKDTVSGFPALDTKNWVLKTDEYKTYSFLIPKDWNAEYLHRRSSPLSSLCELAPNVKLTPRSGVARSGVEIFLAPQRSERLSPDYIYAYSADYQISDARVILSIEVIDRSDGQFMYNAPPDYKADLFRAIGSRGIMLTATWLNNVVPDFQTLNILAHILASTHMLTHPEPNLTDFYNQHLISIEPGCLAERRQYFNSI